MGLDLVELVLEVEETFSFSIRDEDAVNLDTVGSSTTTSFPTDFRVEKRGCLTNVVFFETSTGPYGGAWGRQKRCPGIVRPKRDYS